MGENWSSTNQGCTAMTASEAKRNENLGTIAHENEMSIAKANEFLDIIYSELDRKLHGNPGSEKKEAQPSGNSSLFGILEGTRDKTHSLHLKIEMISSLVSKL